MTKHTVRTQRATQRRSRRGTEVARHPGQERGADAVAPVPASAHAMLARSEAELVAAQLASAPQDRFLHAHLAALRAGAAVLEVTGRPVRRPAPRTVWDMVTLVAPDLGSWAAFFAAGAAARSAIEAGREDVVDDERAERTVCAAEDFQDAVRALLDATDALSRNGSALRSQGALALRAS